MERSKEAVGTTWKKGKERGKRRDRCEGEKKGVRMRPPGFVDDGHGNDAMAARPPASTWYDGKHAKVVPHARRRRKKNGRDASARERAIRWTGKTSCETDRNTSMPWSLAHLTATHRVANTRANSWQNFASIVRFAWMGGIGEEMRDRCVDGTVADSNLCSLLHRDTTSVAMSLVGSLSSSTRRIARSVGT